MSECVRPAMGVLRLEAAHVADVAAAVGLRVGVDDLAVEAGFRHADAVAVQHLRRGVDDEDNDLALSRSPQKSDDAVVASWKSIHSKPSWVSSRSQSAGSLL